jgi:hypothetical protein
MINHIYTQEKEGQMMKLKNYYQSVPYKLLGISQEYLNENQKRKKGYYKKFSSIPY